MPSYDNSNVDILCVLVYLFPGERASFYRHVLYAYRNDGEYLNHRTRSFYQEYFRYNYDGYQSNKVNPYHGKCWNRDPADMGWYPTGTAIDRARSTIVELVNNDEMAWLVSLVHCLRDFLART